MEYLRIAADNGSVFAMEQLGWHYDSGTFVKRNVTKAIEYYRRAASIGGAWAQVNLGVMYLDGRRTVERNCEMAVRLFRSAARKNDVLAFYNLGLCYDYGKGVRQSDALACKYYSKAAACGHVASMCNLGAILVDCEESQKDGVMMTRRAAIRGDDKAQLNLGEWYACGECGLKKNRRLALKWLGRSAKLGNKKAAKAMTAIKGAGGEN